MQLEEYGAIFNKLRLVVAWGALGYYSCSIDDNFSEDPY
jgi:hypothetical protein